MERLELIRPSAEYAGQVMEYRSEMLAHGSSFDGCAGLKNTDSYEAWADFAPRLRAQYGEGYVPSEVFLAVRKADGRLTGIIDYRHPLSDFLLRYGGHIGYSVRPSERRQGYASEMLRLILPVCRAFGEKRVLVCCNRNNEPSRRTILGCGGVLENEAAHGGEIIQRYWITL